MLQHRGQESTGICCEGAEFFVHKDKGLVTEVLTDKILEKAQGHSGIGHVRYSTQGDSDSIHAQPHVIDYMGEKVAIAHNGNIKALTNMKKQMEKEGEIFLTNSDTEIILKKITKELAKKPSEWTIEEVGKTLENHFTGGAWSILLMLPQKIMGFRDPLGYRPLAFCDAEEGFFISSEDPSFQMLQIKKIINISAGEGVLITKDKYEIKKFVKKNYAKKQCVFEHIYFARPDSNVFGKNVYLSRVELGKRCARENPADADVVIPIMDSGIVPAIGFSQESGIPLQIGLIKNSEIKRTFILPNQKTRQDSVLKKLSPMKEIIENKRIVIIDDSIVRGTTSIEIVKMMKKAGAKEVHFRTASPKILNTCQWGVDIPSKEELIANKYKDTQELQNFIGADTLSFLSLKELQEVFGETDWCYSCLNGDKK